MNEKFKQFLITAAIALAGAGTGAGGVYLGGKTDNDITIRMTDEQVTLLKNDALCEAKLKETFAKAIEAKKFSDKQIIITPDTAKLSQKDCPKP